MGLESVCLRIGCRVTHNLTPECGLVLPRSVSIESLPKRVIAEDRHTLSGCQPSFAMFLNFSILTTG